MPPEPPNKRAACFIDGQNLFHAVRESFGYTYPNYDVQALSRAVCRGQGWTLAKVCFYTGIPDRSDDAFWNKFWTGKLAVMGEFPFSRATNWARNFQDWTRRLENSRFEG